MIPELTVKIVQGHDNIQVSTQDLTNLADQGRVIGWVNSYMVARFIPGGRQMYGSGGWKASVPEAGRPE